MIVYLGLGSNLGDRMRNIESAVFHLNEGGVIVTRASSVEETEPVDYTAQPMFLNCVLRCETALSPLELLSFIKKTEAAMGRVESFCKGPRLIDIDILLYGELVLKTDELTIPHPGILKRNFVMRELLELDADLFDIESGVRYSEVLYDCKKNDR